MSINTCVYLGAYLACYLKDRVVEEEVRTCVSPECSRFGASKKAYKFCPQCGSLLRRTVIDTRRPLTRGELEEEFKSGLEFLCPRPFLDAQGVPFEVVVYPVTAGQESATGILLNFEEEQALLIRPMDRQKHLHFFRVRMEEDQRNLEEILGTTNVQLRWGVVSWYE